MTNNAILKEFAADLDLIALQQLQDVLKAEISLYEFIKQAWPSIEGSTPFVDSWHIRAIADHLEACFNREIKNLLINVPPRTLKTGLISVAFPAWVWLHNPQEKFMYASYAASLATQHSLKCKRLIESPWYQQRWGNRYQLARDQKAKGFFENNKKGYRLSTSVGGSATGAGGNFLVADDPNNAREYESDVKRESANSWWDQVWSTRLNDPKNDIKIVVQQRIHEKDISGHIIGNDRDNEWVRLILPMEFETIRKSRTFINGKLRWEDPRTNDGQLLSSVRFSDKEINQYKNDLGSYGYAGQYQQRPAPLEGGIIKKDWFKWWIRPVLPKLLMRLQSWDCGISDSTTASYSACTTWGVFVDDDKVKNVVLLSMWRGQVGYPDLRKRAIRLFNNYNDIDDKKGDNTFKPVDKVIIEAKATGDPLIRDLRLAGISAIGYIPRGDKETRVQRISHLIETGRIWLPTVQKNPDKLISWADEFREEVCCFPNKESRDLVDTMSQILQYMVDSRILYPSGNDSK